MKRNISVISCLIISLIISGCGPGQLSTPTVTPQPTSTAPATPTKTPSPTLTSTPTKSPTPIPEMGKPITNDNWEVTLLAAVFRERIVSTGRQLLPTDSQILIDVVVKVKNLNPLENPSIVLTNLVIDDSVTAYEIADSMIIDENGKSWFPVVSGNQIAISGKEIDPFSVGIVDLFSFTNVTVDESGVHYINTIVIENESYLRFIYLIGDASLGKTIGFRFLDMPAIPFIINK